jgi:hypothetical protein
MSAPTSPSPPQDQIAPPAPPEDAGSSAAGQPPVIEEGARSVPDGGSQTRGMDNESDGPLTPPGGSATPQLQTTAQGVPDGQGGHPPGDGRTMRNALPLSKLGL